MFYNFKVTQTVLYKIIILNPSQNNKHLFNKVNVYGVILWIGCSLC